MAASTKIKSYFNPTIVLDAIEINDTEFGSDGAGTKDTHFRLSKTLGDFSPFIVINNMRFDTKLIHYFELDLSGFLPKCTVTLEEIGGIFASQSFPKDGDLISVYMRSRSPDFKSIRNDFRILDVPPRPSQDPQGEKNKFTLSGVLNVPGLHDEKMAVYTGTSFEVLQMVAKELNLGFASNDNATNDAMNWICPADTPLKFITQDLAIHAYKDESSFYHVFIDQYYFLNLIEVNSMVVHDIEPEKVKTVNTNQDDFLDNQNSPLAYNVLPLVLTNNDTAMNTPNFITKYAPLNNSGNVSLKNAYRRIVQQYNKNDQSRIEYFLETLVTQGSDNLVILKGRKDFDHTKSFKYKYVGVQVDDNMHKNYVHALIQNYINNTELTKWGMVLELLEINPAIYKYQPIPIIIVNKGNLGRKNLTDDYSKQNPEGNDVGTTDQVLSGVYVISDIKYIFSFSQGKFVPRIIAYKRELQQTVKS